MDDDDRITIISSWRVVLPHIDKHITLRIWENNMTMDCSTSPTSKPSSWLPEK